MRPTPAAGTRLFFLEADAVLFSQSRQELHVLNTTAAVIWCLLEEGWTERRIADDLSARFSLPPTEADGFVVSALADWAAQGLLAGSEGPRRPAPSPGWNAPRGLPAYSAPAEFAATRTYRLLTTRFSVRFAAAEHFALLHPVLAHLEEDGEPDVRFDLLASAGRTTLFCDSEPVDGCAQDDMLVPVAYASIWMTALRRHRLFLNIHAGVVSSPAGCVLLPASPGSGKSTLTAALLHAGLGYFSDEVALLSDDLAIAPFPQAICLKESGIAAVTAFRPEAAHLPLHRRSDGKRVAYLPPPRARLAGPEERGTVRALVFPRYVAGAALRFQPIARSVALARLLGQCTVLERTLDVASVDRLVSWIGGLECRDLVYGDTEEGVAAVTGLLAELCCGVRTAGAVPKLRSSVRTRNTQTAK